MISIAAIIVTYETDSASLVKLCDVLIKQFKAIYIIDNSVVNRVELPREWMNNVTLINMDGNVGIAKAQNIGVTAAFAAGATDVILFDQDSLPSDTMVVDLLNAREAAEAQGLLVAAVGPQQRDPRNGELSKFVYAGSCLVSLIGCGVTNSYCIASFLIASGCLISKQAWEVVGEMESDFFIDCVDIEWGFRAASKGYLCIGSFDAKLSHVLGDKKICIGSRSLTNHVPIRHYYFYRNFYRLLLRKYVPISWKVHVFIKSIIQALIFSSLTQDYFLHAKMILKGVRHGLSNRGGKLQ